MTARSSSLMSEMKVARGGRMMHSQSLIVARAWYAEAAASGGRAGGRVLKSPAGRTSVRAAIAEPAAPLPPPSQ
jgi:uncharacterized membrane protein